MKPRDRKTGREQEVCIMLKFSGERVQQYFGTAKIAISCDGSMGGKCSKE